MTVFPETTGANSVAEMADELRYIVERTEYAFSVYEKKIRELEARVRELEEANV